MEGRRMKGKSNPGEPGDEPSEASRPTSHAPKLSPSSYASQLWEQVARKGLFDLLLATILVALIYSGATLLVWLAPERWPAIGHYAHSAAVTLGFVYLGVTATTVSLRFVLFISADLARF